METKVTKDGVALLVLPEWFALYVNDFHENTPMYEIHDDGNTVWIESEHQLCKSLQKGIQVGVEAERIKDLLPECPKCGNRLTPSITDDSWECLECDENFTEFEI